MRRSRSSVVEVQSHLSLMISDQEVEEPVVVPVVHRRGRVRDFPEDQLPDCQQILPRLEIRPTRPKTGPTRSTKT